MKKKIVIVIVVLLIIVLGGTAILYTKDNRYVPSQQYMKFMTEINAANSIIWYYGNLDPEKEVIVNYKKVEEFTEDVINDENHDYAYHAVLIFDLDGTMDISDEELKIIKKHCEEDCYDLIYYGTAHLEQFKKCGYFTMLDSGEQGLTYNGSY